MFLEINRYCQALSTQFETIPSDRKILLSTLRDAIQQKINQEVNLLFICTHNSRRSHFGQIWAAVAADFFNIAHIATFSGGTEATRFHTNAIQALKSLGFEINEPHADNPHCLVKFGAEKSLMCFSKCYDDSVNPQQQFIAVMTCSEAEKQCPLIFGADARITLCYDDPKEFDNTPLQNQKYRERCQQIAIEMLYVFSQIQSLQM